jgi:16S rRNA (guanine527-N7)-methyltransferase
MNEIQNLLVLELKKLPIDLPTCVFNKLFNYIDLLLKANQSVNLTAITDPKEALFKHIYDSLIILNRPEYLSARRIIDIGSGAGIPSIPLAICSPEKQFISLDSVQKKIKFQEQTCQSLNVSNINPIWARAEDFIRIFNEREQFELAVARAVAPLNILSELTLPFVKISGYALLYKGKDYQNELKNAEKTIKIMGGVICDSITTELPFDFGSRSLIIIKKAGTSPLEYPRKAGIPQKKPL